MRSPTRNVSTHRVKADQPGRAPSPTSQNGSDATIGLALLAAIVESSEDAILSKRLDGTITSWNEAARRLFGYSPQEMIGQSVTRLIPPDRLTEEQTLIKRVRRGKRIAHYDTIRVRKNGQPIEVTITISPIRDVNGRIVGASKIARDITDRKRIEKALQDNAERMRAILDTAVDAIVTIDESGLIESVNPASERLFGYSQSKLLGQNVRFLMPEPYQSEHDGYLRNYLRTGTAKIIGIGREVIGLRADGTTFPMNLSVSEVRLNGRRLFTGIVHDLTGRRQLEKQILEASANEQRRIGQDLHDGLCQELVGIGFGAENLATRLMQTAPSEAAAARKLAGMMRQAADQARKLAHGLNPVDVRGGGLPAALRDLAEKVSASFSVQCEFSWDEIPFVGDDTTATHLYRITQEAIGNAIRHGKAKRIQIRLRTENDKLTLAIKDNGLGFPVPDLRPGTVDGAPPTSGIGLQSMNYRARLIDGTFNIVSNPGQRGSTVVCSIRLNTADTRPAAKPANRRKSGKT